MLLTLLPGVALALAPTTLQTPHTKHWAQGPQTGARAGTAFSPAGDWNGDGVDDYAVGIPGHDATQFILGPYEDQGLLQIRSGVDGAIIREYQEPLQTDTGGNVIPLEFGTAVAGPFDTNNNGLPEVAASLPGGNQVVLVERGPTFFQPMTVVARIDGTTIATSSGQISSLYDEERLGDTLANVGDVDGDGIDDLAIGSPTTDLWIVAGLGGLVIPDAGCLRILSGADLLQIAFLGGGDDDELLGTAICGVPDLSGDGRGEVAAGSPGIERVRIWSPVPSSLPFVYDRVLETSAAGYGGFGSALACLGDVDGGGDADLLVGSPESVSTGGPLPFSQGRVSAHALEAAAVSFADTLLWERTRLASDLGRAIAAVDLDGDGVREAVCIEDSNFANSPTEVVALDGATGQLEATFLAPQAETDAAIARLGDLDADGGEDFAVGLPDLDFERGGHLVYGYFLGTPGGGGGPTVWTVDDDGPADFDSVALAALVVNSGDVLRVLPGEYDAATIQRPLSVLGDPALFVSVDLPEVIVDTVGSVSLHQLDLGGLTIQGSNQRTTVSDCRVEGSTTEVVDCADVAFVFCTLTGVAPEGLQFPGPAGARVANSNVQFSQCALTGAKGPQYTADGGPGLIVTAGAEVLLCASTVRGGDGSDGNAEFFLESGSGGVGVRVIGDGRLDVRGNTSDPIEGGDGGPVDLGSVDDGVGIAADAAAIVRVSNPVPVDGWTGPVAFGEQRPWISYAAGAPLGANAYALSYAKLNEIVVVVLSAGALYQDERFVLETPLLIDPLLFIDYTVQVGQGPDTPVLRSWPVPNTPTLLGATVEVQAFQYDLVTDAFYGTNGGRITLVP